MHIKCKQEIKKWIKRVIKKWIQQWDGLCESITAAAAKKGRTKHD